jgi:carboxyl-terminal processing protease
MLSTLDPHSMLLDPTSFTEMQQHTRGSYGGLGILIGLRKGELTVLKPFPGTPASNAGIRAGDRIVRIDGQSTINMLLNDAVAHMSGDPDTTVNIWVRHANETNAQARKLTIRRAIVTTVTVDYKMLANGVGLIKLHGSFAGNSDNEMRHAMADLKAKGLKSLVLDLRGNPGGLLDQAVKIVDEYVDSGTIVTTVGYANKQREEKRATPGSQSQIPMAVLVNHGSASASEIVAGALKNLDRAVIIGTRSFGKGSVQLVYENGDGSALKLTIAQYLTPGDVSIQSVGITPDVELDKVIFDKDQGVWFYRDYKGMSEADLDAHLQSKYAASGDKPFATFKYLARDNNKRLPSLDDDDDDADADDKDDVTFRDPDALVEDYEVDFARDLLSSAKGWKRREVLASSQPFFAKKAAEEEHRIVDALAKQGIDWTSVGASAAAPSLVGTITADKTEAGAGDTIKLTAKITNKGQGVAGQVRATLKADDPNFDGREFLFGRIKPGESRSFTVPVKLPKDALTRTDPIKMTVAEEHGVKAQLDASTLVVKVDGPARPMFSYAYQIFDDIKGNNDGLVQRGESVRLHVTVKNAGTGKANETLAQLRNLSDEGVFINKGRFNVDNLAPGESKSVDFTFDVRPEYKGDAAKVELTVYDAILHEYVTDKLSFPIVAANAKLARPSAREVSPPTLDLAPQPGLVDASTIHLTGTAKDDDRVTDTFVFVSNHTAKIDRRKVFYRSNRKATTPTAQALDAEIPLWPGANVITVVARESPQVQSQRTLIVQRSEPRVAQQTPPPKPPAL